LISCENYSPVQDIGDFGNRVYRWLTPRLQWTRYSGLAALALLVVALVIAWPDLTVFNGPAGWTERAMDWKIDHPFERIPVERFAEPGPELEGASAHLRKRTYRVTVPLAAHLLGLHMRGAAALVFGFGCAFVGLLFLNLRRLLPGDTVAAFLVGAALASSFVVQWGLNDFFFHDAVGYFLLAAVCFTRSPWLIAICVTLGGFSDERVMTALPLVYVLRGDVAITETSFAELRRMNRARLGLIAGLVIVLVLRLIFALRIGHFFDNSIVGLWYLDPNLLLLPVTALFVFKGTILIIAAAFAVLALRYSRQSLFVVVLAASVSIIPSLLVGDIGRSLAYSFPLVLISLKVMLETGGRETLRPLVVYAALFSILTPTYYVWSGKLIPYTPLPFVAAKKLIHGMRHH
jgi:hypothetical protein